MIITVIEVINLFEYKLSLRWIIIKILTIKTGALFTIVMSMYFYIIISKTSY